MENIQIIIPCFCTWLNENAKKFHVKLEITKINHRNVEIIFPTIPDFLTAELYFQSEDYMGIRIAAIREGEIFDWIFDYDALILETKNGYVCDFCEGEKIIYPTLEAFAIAHTFEFFLTWCNENIATSQGLALYGNAEESSSARLVPKDKKLSDFRPDYYFPFDFNR